MTSSPSVCLFRCCILWATTSSTGFLSGTIRPGDGYGARDDRIVTVVRPDRVVAERKCKIWGYMKGGRTVVTPQAPPAYRVKSPELRHRLPTSEVE